MFYIYITHGKLFSNTNKLSGLQGVLLFKVVESGGLLTSLEHENFKILIDTLFIFLKTIFLVVSFRTERNLKNLVQSYFL